MISKPEFLCIMKTLDDQESTYDAINTAIRRSDNVICDFYFFIDNNGSIICKLLSMLLGLDEKDDLLEWWCYQEEFGRKFKVGDIEETWLPEDHKYRTPQLFTAEQVYDYAVYLASDQYKEELMVPEGGMDAYDE